MTNRLDRSCHPCHQSFILGIEQTVVGNRMDDIGYAIDTYAKRFGYGNVEEFTGYAIGKDLW